MVVFLLLLFQWRYRVSVIFLLNNPQTYVHWLCPRHCHYRRIEHIVRMLPADNIPDSFQTKELQHMLGNPLQCCIIVMRLIVAWYLFYHLSRHPRPLWPEDMCFWINPVLDHQVSSRYKGMSRMREYWPCAVPSELALPYLMQYLYVVQYESMFFLCIL